MASKEAEVTKHDKTKHPHPIQPKDRKWYEFLGLKACPVCGAEIEYAKR